LGGGEYAETKWHNSVEYFVFSPSSWLGGGSD
jgi:hypothetical protein